MFMYFPLILSEFNGCSLYCSMFLMLFLLCEGLRKHGHLRPIQPALLENMEKAFDIFDQVPGPHGRAEASGLRGDRSRPTITYHHFQ